MANKQKLIEVSLHKYPGRGDDRVNFEELTIGYFEKEAAIQLKFDLDNQNKKFLEDNHHIAYLAKKYLLREIRLPELKDEEYLIFNKCAILQNNFQVVLTECNVKVNYATIDKFLSR